jgi:uncharacterized NAD(P)/FAD-binding protein YdhS
VTRVAVVGGGAAGAMVVAHLARFSPRAGEIEVLLYEPGERPGRGVAYGTDDPRHLLNVPAARMSALADDHEHFLRWLQQRDRSARGADFRPRCEYGDYLTATLAEHAAAVGLVVRRAPDVDVDRVGAGYHVTHAGGSDTVDAVVLALGHAPARRPAAVATAGAVGYVDDPWASGALQQLLDVTCRGDTVLAIGTGLTAVDVALTLTAHDRRVVAVSRNGSLPHPHLARPVEPLPLALPAGDRPLSLTEVEALVRRHIDVARRRGLDWRAAVDGIRPVTSALWRRLPVDERRRFVDSPLAREWEVARHRMAPAVAAEVGRLRHDQRLTVTRGELLCVSGEERQWRATVRRDDLTERIGAAAVVNCTGPSCDIRAYRGGFGRRLVEAGLVVADPLGLGVQTDAAGAAVDATGHPDPRFAVVGPLRRGSLYESTAVPELRGQAAVVAQRLVRDLTGRAPEAGYPHGAPSRSHAASARGAARPA